MQVYSDPTSLQDTQTGSIKFSEREREKGRKGGEKQKGERQEQEKERMEGSVVGKKEGRQREKAEEKAGGRERERMYCKDNSITASIQHSSCYNVSIYLFAETLEEASILELNI